MGYADLGYFPTTSTTKLSGAIDRRGRGSSGVAAGGGPNFAVTTKMLCVLASSARVRAPGCVGTFSSTLNLSGDSCFTTVSTPSPQEANASPVSASNVVASTPSPIAGVARTLPLSASTTAIILLPQPTNRRRFLRSMESPLGSVQGASGHVAVTSSLLGSMATSSLLSSMLTKILPLASLAANSGLPSSLIVPSTFPVAASIAVESWLRPLNVNTRLVGGSKKLTLPSRPFLTKPRPSSGASAMPCTPGVSAMSPTLLPESASTTITRVAREI